MLYTVRPEDSRLLLAPPKKMSTFVEIDVVSLVKEVAGCLVNLVADEIDKAIFLWVPERDGLMRRATFSALSHTTASRSLSRAPSRSFPPDRTLA